jgi:PEP-CTERM motif
VVPNGTVVAFNQNFFIPGTVDSGWLTVMGDDSLAVLLNGNTLLLEAPSSGNTYATCSDFGAGCLPSTQVTLDLKPYLNTGDNTLQFLVAQRAGASFGLNYAGEIHDTAPVPEPATILMFGTGLLGVLGAARRKLQR